MKFKKPISLCCLFLTALMLVSLWGCSSSPSPTPTPGGLNKPTSVPTDGEDPTEAPTLAPDDEAPKMFTVENLKEAKIVYPKNEYAAGGMVYTELTALQERIERSYGFVIPVTTDEIKENSTSKQYKEFEYEILIGDTNREESGEKFNDLLINDFGYAIVGKKIIIKGGNDASLLKALEQFRITIVLPKKGGKTVFYKQTWDTVSRQEYLAQNVMLNGAHISKYAVVYPAGSALYEKELAHRLANSLITLSGYEIPCYSDATAAGEYEILIGKTNRAFSVTTTSGAAVEAAGKNIAVIGDNAYQYGLAESRLMELFNTAVSQLKSEVTIPALTAVTDRSMFSMMAYNVYGFEVYQQRCDNICTLVTKYLPDIVAFQEPALDMMALLDMSNYYAYYNGIPRHTAAVGPQQTGSMTINGQSVTIGGANSVASILYAKDRYDLIEGGTKWMTDTPDTFSKLDNSSHYRIYTYVVLKDKVTGVEFVVVNHHLDFDPQIQDTTMRYAFKFFKENYNDLPVIMLGDYNATKNEPVIKDIMVEKGGFSSLYDMSPRKGSGAASIDWIFAMDCCVSGLYYNYCTETYSDKGGPYSHKYDGKMPSDHAPVYAEMQFSIKSEHTHDWTEASAGVYWKGEDH